MEVIKDTVMKPSLEETVGDDLGSVVVTTTVVEKTEVSVVKMVQQEDDISKNQEEGEQKEGYYGNLADVKMAQQEDDISKNQEEVEPKEGYFGDLPDAKMAQQEDDISKNQEEVEHKEGYFGNLPDAKMAQQEDDISKNQEEVEPKEGYFGNLADENGTPVAMDVDSNPLAGENGSYKNPDPEGYFGNLAEVVEPKNDEEDHNFVVGDFVWGKVKSHPWWPGQIYDDSDASDNANAIKRKGLLVAYFGDGSFSWSSPSKLKPFIENFQKMSRQSDSKKFVNAVQKSLEQVSSLIKAELVCKCQNTGVVNMVNVVNLGIKENTRVPKGNTVKVLTEGIKPVEIISTIKGYATMEPGTRVVELELAVVKGFLSAFYGKRGGYALVEYHDPTCVEGLEEEEEETRGGYLLGSPENGDDKLYQKRKQKSVAELLGEEESKVKKGMKKERKRKSLVVSVVTESDPGTGEGGDVEDETMSPRQRKKSRYLSPPYLSPVGSGRFSVFASGTGSGSGSFKEPKTEPEKVPEKVVEKLSDSLKKSGGKRTREKSEKSVNVTKVLEGVLRAALDPSSFVEKEKNLPEITEVVSSFRSSVFKEGSRSSKQTEKDKKKVEEGSLSRKQTGSRKKTGKKKAGEDGEEGLELVFIKQKVEWMSEMVEKCEESEMSADVKASLKGGMQEVLEKVVALSGK